VRGSAGLAHALAVEEAAGEHRHALAIGRVFRVDDVLLGAALEARRAAAALALTLATALALAVALEGRLQHPHVDSERVVCGAERPVCRVDIELYAVGRDFHLEITDGGRGRLLEDIHHHREGALAGGLGDDAAGLGVGDDLVGEVVCEGDDRRVDLGSAEGGLLAGDVGAGGGEVADGVGVDDVTGGGDLLHGSELEVHILPLLAAAGVEAEACGPIDELQLGLRERLPHILALVNERGDELFALVGGHALEVSTGEAGLLEARGELVVVVTAFAATGGRRLAVHGEDGIIIQGDEVREGERHA